VGYGKTVILLSLIVLYIIVAVNNPPPWFKAIGYNQVLDVYGKVAAEYAPLNWLSNPGLRTQVADKAESAYALIPDNQQNHQKRIQSALETAPLALIECSAVDTWHTTEAGFIVPAPFSTS
jgi:hypothetical protein